MYTYYERFIYSSSTSTKEGVSVYVHKVEVFPNPQPRFVEKMVQKYGQKVVRRTKSSNKLYVRQLVRKARVQWSRNKDGSRGDIDYNYVENYILGIAVGSNPADVL